MSSETTTVSNTLAITAPFNFGLFDKTKHDVGNIICLLFQILQFGMFMATIYEPCPWFIRLQKWT